MERVVRVQAGVCSGTSGEVAEDDLCTIRAGMLVKDGRSLIQALIRNLGGLRTARAWQRPGVVKSQRQLGLPFTKLDQPIVA
ncbi:hypothetical protein [Pasteuria penetrans]|uniref:hypothetical protein n=1 Tax=Pasteuria penetrans TaxID=86005 RepID=UPI000FC0D224|nr:hypothetical protein [Pasteuria penetrans]